MPIKVPNNLPAYEVLKKEKIFMIPEIRADHQDIRPLKIVLLNLMPTKIATETQWLRLLGNTPLQVDVTLLKIKSYTSKNTPAEHLDTFYKHFEDIRDQKFDGLVITGAPLEDMEFEDVAYWDELTDIMEWSKKNVFSTLYVCWGAVAGLYYHYGIKRKLIDEKIFGVFEHRVCKDYVKLLRGIDDVFYVPHSRYFTLDKEEVEACDEVEILAESAEAGVYMIADKKRRKIFVTGHAEYSAHTLSNEYFRDVDKGMDTKIPVNYFEDDDPNKEPVVRWRSTSHIMVYNWLNYYLYQETPYDISSIDETAFVDENV